MEWKMLEYFMTIWNILHMGTFGTVFSHLVHFSVWYVWTKKNLAILPSTLFFKLKERFIFPENFLNGESTMLKGKTIYL
jgi:hypothetical protein